MAKKSFRILPLILLSLIVLGFLWLPKPQLTSFTNVSQDDETLEAKVTAITDQTDLKQDLNVKFLNGSLKNESATVHNDKQNTVQPEDFSVGQKVIVLKSKDAENKTTLHVIDHVRRDKIFILFGIFVAVVLLITRFQGFTSLLGMAFSFLVLFQFILPRLLTGGNPILISILGCIIIIPVTFYLSHGFNKKTTISVVGTVITLIITGLLAAFFVKISFLSGLASDDASFLKLYTGDTIDFRGLLLAGIIISLLGILDDITISQSAVVQELYATKQTLSYWQLYKKAMNVGRDHIASIVNTLILVYAGAALPLFLLFIDQSNSASEVLNYEMIAEEAVQTLVASIGLVLAVPITTLLACTFVSNKDKISPPHSHSH